MTCVVPRGRCDSAGRRRTATCSQHRQLIAAFGCHRPRGASWPAMAADRPCKAQQTHPRRSAPRRHKHAHRMLMSPRSLSTGRDFGALYMGGARSRFGGRVGRGTAVRLDHARHSCTMPALGVGRVEWRLATGTLHRRYPRRLPRRTSDPASPARSNWPPFSLSATAPFVSHRSAAALGIGQSARPAQVEVTVVGRAADRVMGCGSTGSSAWRAADRGDIAGIPVTSPARTVIDFAATTGARARPNARSPRRAPSS